MKKIHQKGTLEFDFGTGDEPEIQALCEVYDRSAEVWAYDAAAVKGGGAAVLRTFHGHGAGEMGTVSRAQPRSADASRFDRVVAARVRDDAARAEAAARERAVASERARAEHGGRFVLARGWRARWDHGAEAVDEDDLARGTTVGRMCWVHDATGEVSWAEARCMLRNRKIAFLGDSNSRFHWMTFNWFLETGKLRVARGSKYDKRGVGRGVLGSRPRHHRRRGDAW